MEIKFLDRRDMLKEFPNLSFCFDSFFTGIGILVKRSCSNEELKAGVLHAQKEMEEKIGILLDISLWIDTPKQQVARPCQFSGVKGITNLFAHTTRSFHENELKDFECEHIYLHYSISDIPNEIENNFSIKKITIQRENSEFVALRDECKKGKFVETARKLLAKQKSKDKARNLNEM